jgi:5-(carboxyamino)imidazole ribonucleotide mutase
MGSDSDLPVMKDAARILNMFGVPYEVTSHELQHLFWIF